VFIPPGQPWKNGFIESFHDEFRDECLQREWFLSLLEAQVVIEDWRLHYVTGHAVWWYLSQIIEDRFGSK